MQNTEKAVQTDSGLPRGGSVGGFVAVDDAGAFTFYPGAPALVADFDYTAQAICIVARDGTGFRLVQDADRELTLAGSLGPVDFSWLRQAWLRAQRKNPGEYPLRRFYPAGRATLLDCMFETLYLEHAMEPLCWHVMLDGRETEAVSLQDIDSALRGRHLVEHVHVQDPYGHLYRPVRVPGHSGVARGRRGKVTIFVEVPAAGAQAGHGL